MISSINTFSMPYFKNGAVQNMAPFKPFYIEKVRFVQSEGTTR